jgi:uncharacterized protein
MIYFSIFLFKRLSAIMLSMEKVLFFSFLSLTLLAVASFTALGVFVAFELSLFQKRIIISLAIAGPVFFILANVLFSYFPNNFSQFFYIVNSYFGGVFLYWFFASIIICLLFLLSQFVFFPINKIAFFLYMIASLVGIIGIVQAFFIKTVTYEIKTPSQYTELIGKRAVLVADTHFGPANQEIFARQVVNKILNAKPDFVLIAGDMFDGVAFDSLGVEDEFKKITKDIPVFFTPGNHEEYGPYREFLESANRAGMKVLVDESSLIFNVPIFGLNYRSNKDTVDIEKVLSTNISKEKPAIVLNHEPLFQDLLKDKGVFLVVSGHTHGGQLWPGRYIAKRIYKEYLYGLVTSEYFNSITTSGVGTYGPRLRTFNTPEIVLIEFK